jgi:hypothetical protein
MDIFRRSVIVGGYYFSVCVSGWILFVGLCYWVDIICRSVSVDGYFSSIFVIGWILFVGLF